MIRSNLAFFWPLSRPCFLMFNYLVGYCVKFNEFQYISFRFRASLTQLLTVDQSNSPFFGAFNFWVIGHVLCEMDHSRSLPRQCKFNRLGTSTNRIALLTYTGLLVMTNRIVRKRKNKWIVKEVLWWRARSSQRFFFVDLWLRTHQNIQSRVTLLATCTFSKPAAQRRCSLLCSRAAQKR